MSTGTAPGTAAAAAADFQSSGRVGEKKPYELPLRPASAKDIFKLRETHPVNEFLELTLDINRDVLATLAPTVVPGVIVLGGVLVNHNPGFYF